MKKVSFYKSYLFVLIICFCFLSFSSLSGEEELDDFYRKLEHQHTEAQFDSLAVTLKLMLIKARGFQQHEQLKTTLLQYQPEWEKSASDFARSEIYYHLAKTFLNTRDSKGAEKWWAESLKLKENLPTPDTVGIALNYQWLGEVAMRQGKLNKSLERFKTSIGLLEQANEMRQDFVPELYYFIGVIHTQKGNYTEALAMVKKGQRSANEILDDKNYIHAMLLLLHGNIYSFKQESEAALPIHLKALDHVLNGEERFHKELGAYYNNVAICYARMKRFKEAEQYFKEAYKYERKRWGDENTILFFEENNLGEVAFDQGRLEEAKSRYEAAAGALRNALGEHNAYMPKVYNNIGKVWLKKEKPEEALKWFQKAICSNTGQEFKENEVNDLPPLDFYFNSVELMTSVRLKGKAILDSYEKTKEEDLFEQAQNLYQKADQVIDQTRRTYIEPSNKISFGKTVKGIYEDALHFCELALQQNQKQELLEQAFYFSEKSKAIVLLQSVSGNQALQFAGLPDSLLAKEIELKKSMVQLQKQQFAAQQQENKEQITQIGEELEQIQKDYQSFIQQIEQDFPNYYQLKYNLDMMGLSEIQAYLKIQKSALVEYFIGEKKSFAILVMPEKVQLVPIEGEGLEEKIKTFRTQFFTPENLGDATADDFSRQSGDLHEILLQPFWNEIKTSAIQRFIVVPDEYLAYLPFEVLTKKTDNEKSLSYRNIPYLINDYALSYSWSATLLQRQQLSGLNVKYNYAGFAPYYDESVGQQLDSLDLVAANLKTRSGWQDLPAARQSVNSIADFLNGKAFLENKAIKENFFEIATDSRILHFAMHALADDEDPLHSKLLFYGNNPQEHLHAFELYNTPIKTELAVLSACNTGFGQLKKGEGIMSLSRAFTWAGCPSVVMSQWSVPDAASGAIMVDFHQNLKNGQTKDEALRQAKLAWLNNSDIAPDRLHPYFWAGFVPMGNMEKMDLRTANKWWWYLGTAAVVIFLLFVGWKQKT